MMRRTLFSSLAILSLLIATGCADDPYSQRRIHIREERLNANANDINKREIDGNRRLQEKDQDAKEWLRRDTERFNERSKMVGDYLW